MATWIVHLCLSENLLQRNDGLDSHQFAIGNVAPDSGVPDIKWERFEPPAKVTHFRISGHGAWPMADLEFYRRYLVPVRRADREVKRLSFLLGYFFHLVTDNLWIHQIYRPTKARYTAEFEADPAFIWEVKRDWYGLDLHYVRAHPGTLFWRVFLESEYSEDYLDFMPGEAVRQRVEYIKALYQRRDEEIEKKYGQRPFKYLSEAEVDDFVESATQRLYLIHQCLWAGKASTAGYSSALELPLDADAVDDAAGAAEEQAN